MIAKLVAYGDRRDAAIARLDRALGETTLSLVGPAGPARTNIELLRRLLADPAFASGTYDTGLAEALAKALKKAGGPNDGGG
jgi:3-methylcrotonyl-CoA carboxylase alpha subunit